MKMLKPLKGKKILDVGCGPGNLAKEMADLRASIVAVDQSEKWIRICKKRHEESRNLKFLTADGGRLSFIQSKSVDAVVLNLVLPNVNSLNEVKRIFKEVGRVLKKGGIFIFSDLHPICVMTPKISPDRYQKYSRDFSYFKDGSVFVAGVVLNKDGKKKIEFKNRHWKLETYSRLLEQAGLYIYKLSEPTYSKRDPVLLRRYRIPEYLLFGCKKFSR